jgi:DNA-binding MarR family transcriptional regulator
LVVARSNWNPQHCNWSALREAVRHVGSLYEGQLAASGLTMGQFTLLSALAQCGPMSINNLAAKLVMDRTTLGRNAMPLERRRLLSVRRSARDGRSRELQLTRAGSARLKAGAAGWQHAQRVFETTFGAQRAAEMRALLSAAVKTEFAPSPATTPH